VLFFTDPGYRLKVWGYTELLLSYRNIGKMDDAEEVLDRMQQQGVYPSVRTYTGLVRGYVWKRDMQKAEDLVSRMSALPDEKKRPNHVTYNILLDGYADRTLRLRQKLKQMQDGLGEQQTKDEMQHAEQRMMGVLQRMTANIKIGERVYQTLIDACGDDVEKAEGWVAKMKEKNIVLSPWTLLEWGKVLARAGKTEKEMEALLDQV
jgi:pentatricopeptide repeat protein